MPEPQRLLLFECGDGAQGHARMEVSAQTPGAYTFSGTVDCVPLPEPGLVALLLAALLVLWLSPAHAEPGAVVRGAAEVSFAWTPATGPVARYGVEWSDGTVVGLVDATTARVRCPVTGAGQLVVRAVDPSGALGPASVPSSPVLCVANPAYDPDANGDGTFDGLDLPAMRQVLDGAEILP